MHIHVSKMQPMANRQFALHSWSLIAGRLPGRTDNEVKNYWNTHLNKKPTAAQIPHLDSKSVQNTHSSLHDDENLAPTTAATTVEGAIDTTDTESWLENLRINADYGMMMNTPPPPDYLAFFHGYETFVPVVDDLVLSGPFGCSEDEIIMQETMFL